jgi:hypothetical protein
MCELSECEYTLAGVSLDRFFANATQKAQIVLPDGLVTAAVAELADAAMVIQQQLRRPFGSLQALGLPEEVFCSHQGRPETNARPRAVTPKIDNSTARKRPLNPRQKNRSRGELLAIGSANPSRRAKYHRLILEVSER